jgi:hypothetical protein
MFLAQRTFVQKYELKTQNASSYVREATFILDTMFKQMSVVKESDLNSLLLAHKNIPCKPSIVLKLGSYQI